MGETEPKEPAEPLVTLTLPASALQGLPALIEALEEARVQAVRLGLLGPGPRGRR